jgi:uncharacterized membrane protein
MNEAHLHLLFNHLPIVGGIIGTSILIAGFLLKNNTVVKQTALGVLIFSGLTAVPAFFTGEGAEEVVENIGGISHDVIEAHEDLGKLFFIFMMIGGVLSVITFVASLRKHKMTNMLFAIVLLLSLVSCVMAQRAGTSGGEIRHTEIRNGALNNTTTPGQGEEEDD